MTQFFLIYISCILLAHNPEKPATCVPYKFEYDSKLLCETQLNHHMDLYKGKLFYKGDRPQNDVVLLRPMKCISDVELKELTAW